MSVQQTVVTLPLTQAEVLQALQTSDGGIRAWEDPDAFRL